jgi:hypothetical protein
MPAGEGRVVDDGAQAAAEDEKPEDGAGDATEQAAALAPELFDIPFPDSIYNFEVAQGGAGSARRSSGVLWGSESRGRH